MPKSSDSQSGVRWPLRARRLWATALTLLLCGLPLLLGQACALRPAGTDRPPPAPPGATVPEHPASAPTARVPPPPRPPVAQRPEWVRDGSGAFLGRQGPLFNAVGQAGGLSHRSLLRAAADNQARTLMAAELKNFLEALVKKAGVADPDGQTGQVVSELTAELLKNAIISDHYSDAAQGRLYSLCTIDLATIKRLIGQAVALEEPTRRRLVTAADQVHQQRLQAPH